jgi:3-methylcrotonyl-CoA carboxylase alpha subunit
LQPHPWDSLQGWRLWGVAEQVARFDDAEVRVRTSAPGQFEAETPEGSVAFSLSGDPWMLDEGGRKRPVRAVRHGWGVTVFADDQAQAFTLLDPLARVDEAMGGGDMIAAPMTGQIRMVAATSGNEVRKGDVLVVMEAMKMEHSLSAPRDGVVAEVLTGTGDQVDEGMLLVTLEPEGD